MHYPDLSPSFGEFLNDLTGKRVAVLGHMRPDGDCIGSQVALTRILRQRGIDAIAVNPDPVPRVLAAFVEDTPMTTTTAFDGRADCAVTVDCADQSRFGKPLRERFPEIEANIDHHISNDGYARRNFIHAQSSATAEILAGLFFDGDLTIDPVTAQALYVGIATDTGQFRFPSTTARVFEICVQLTACGADPASAAHSLYENESRSKIALLQRFLASFRYECGNRVCIGILPEGVYGETGADKEESEGLVDYARAIDGVDIGILLEERNGAVKGSFRSKDPIHRVDQLAGEFNGGGHACAAGFNLQGNLDRFYPQLIERLERHFNELSPAIPATPATAP